MWVCLHVFYRICRKMINSKIAVSHFTRILPNEYEPDQPSFLDVASRWDVDKLTSFTCVEQFQQREYWSLSLGLILRIIFFFTKFFFVRRKTQQDKNHLKLKHDLNFLFSPLFKLKITKLQHKIKPNVFVYHLKIVLSGFHRYFCYFLKTIFDFKEIEKFYVKRSAEKNADDEPLGFFRVSYFVR